MHEIGMIKGIIEEARKRGNVKAITLEVGELSGMEADHLKEHFKELVDWNVKVKEKKARVECECGFKGHPDIEYRGHDFVLFKCPWCGDVPEVLAGREIILREVVCV